MNKRNIPGIPGHSIDTDGNVYDERKIRPPCLSHDFRILVNIRRKTYVIGRLVLLTFVRAPLSNEVCDYKDNNPTNTTLDNLYWKMLPVGQCVRTRESRHSRYHQERVQIRKVLDE